MNEHAVSPDDEDRIRRKAHELWEAEGRPEGRSDAHWTMAREIVANEDSYPGTLQPVPEDGAGAEPAEPAIALENQGDFPGLADQGEETAHAPRRTAAGGRARAGTYGEPKGPRPPNITVVDKPAHAIERRGGEADASNVTASDPPPRAAGPGDVAVKGFYGGVEHSQEMKAARRDTGRGSERRE
jgi:hypothetical protein